METCKKCGTCYKPSATFMHDTITFGIMHPCPTCALAAKLGFVAKVEKVDRYTYPEIEWVKE